MAEIKIKEKKPVWPWILIGALILAILLYFLVFADDDDEIDDIDDVTTQQNIDSDNDESYNDEQNSNSEDMDMATSDDAVAKYTDYIGDSSKMGIDHEYSHGALTYLIDAVQSKADDYDVDITADISKARESAEEITTDPYEVNHADNIKKAGQIIVNALSTIQQQKFPNLSNELTEVRTAVEAIVKEEHTLNQKGDVTKFYGAANSLLTKMK